MAGIDSERRMRMPGALSDFRDSQWGGVAAERQAEQTRRNRYLGTREWRRKRAPLP